MEDSPNQQGGNAPQRSVTGSEWAAMTEGQREQYKLSLPSTSHKKRKPCKPRSSNATATKATTTKVVTTKPTVTPSEWANMADAEKELYKLSLKTGNQKQNTPTKVPRDHHGAPLKPMKPQTIQCAVCGGKVLQDKDYQRTRCCQRCKILSRIQRKEQQGHVIASYQQDGTDVSSCCLVFWTLLGRVVTTTDTSENGKLNVPAVAFRGVSGHNEPACKGGSILRPVIRVVNGSYIQGFLNETVSTCNLSEAWVGEENLREKVMRSDALKTLQDHLRKYGFDPETIGTPVPEALTLEKRIQIFQEILDLGNTMTTYEELEMYSAMRIPVGSGAFGEDYANWSNMAKATVGGTTQSSQEADMSRSFVMNASAQEFVPNA